jgi:hypothetical protein
MPDPGQPPFTAPGSPPTPVYGHGTADGIGMAQRCLWSGWEWLGTGYHRARGCLSRLTSATGILSGVSPSTCRQNLCLAHTNACHPERVEGSTYRHPCLARQRLPYGHPGLRPEVPTRLPARIPPNVRHEAQEGWSPATTPRRTRSTEPAKDDAAAAAPARLSQTPSSCACEAPVLSPQGELLPRTYAIIAARRAAVPCDIGCRTVHPALARGMVGAGALFPPSWNRVITIVIRMEIAREKGNTP